MSHQYKSLSNQNSSDSQQIEMTEYSNSININKIDNNINNNNIMNNINMNNNSQIDRNIEKIEKIENIHNSQNIQNIQFSEMNEINENIENIQNNQNNSQNNDKIIQNIQFSKMNEMNKNSENISQNEIISNVQNIENNSQNDKIIQNIQKPKNLQKNENETQIDISTSSSDDLSRPTTTNRHQSFSTIFLPNPHKDELDGYIDIDGYVTPYDYSQNIFVQLFLLVFPCFSKPFCSQYKCEKILRALFSISFLICGVLICVFVLELLQCGATSFSKNPGLGPSSEGLRDFGARYSYAIKIDLEVYRMFSCLFLSPNVLVLFLEIVLLMRYLIYFERRWGILLFVVTYFVTGEAGVLVSTFVDQNNVSVCATCPFSGLIAVYLVEIGLTKKLEAMEAKRSIYLALVVIFILCVIQISPLLDLSAMIGSGAVGVALGMLYFLGENKWFCEQNVIFQTCIYGAVVVFLLGYVLVCCLGIFVTPPVKIY